MAENKENEEIAVLESDDGSAVVDLPENLLISDQNDGQGQVKTEKSEANAENSDDQDHPDDDEAVRAAKRNRRRAKKDLIRKTNQEKDARLEQLQRENAEMQRRLSVVERGAKTDGIMRIDRGIEDAQTQVEYAKMKLAEAIASSDGQAGVEAQMLLNNATDELRKLAYQRRQAEQDMRQPQTQSNSGADPTVQKLAGKWMSSNSWYNPDATDRDSRIAKKEDELLAAEGWDPTDPDYWAELTDRLQKKLPHRYNDDNHDGDDNRNTRRPRNNVASSGREASAAYGGSNRSQFILSPDRVAAMKSAGAWENPERKAKMIKQFIAYDRNNKR